jgi:hypothetical protein
MAPHYFPFIDKANLPRPPHVETGPTNTAGYSAPNPPTAQEIPSHLKFDPQLTQKMQISLRSYLRNKCHGQEISNLLAQRLNVTQGGLARRLPNLTDESTASNFFVSHVETLVSCFVLEVDDVGVQLEGAPLEYGAKPDGIWGGCVHVEFKSARVLLDHAVEILNIANANNGSGSALGLGSHETNGRSIIFKVSFPCFQILLLLNGSTTQIRLDYPWQQRNSIGRSLPLVSPPCSSFGMKLPIQTEIYTTFFYVPNWYTAMPSVPPSSLYVPPPS